MTADPGNPNFQAPRVVGGDPLSRFPIGGELVLARPALLAGAFLAVVRMPGEPEKEVVLDYGAQGMLLAAWYLSEPTPRPLPRTADEWRRFNESWRENQQDGGGL
jgi:hypothetical protein